MSFNLWPKGGITKKNIQLYNTNPSSQEIDLRKEVIKILDGTDFSPQRGHWVLLRRVEKSQRCICWNEVAEGTAGFLDDKRKYDEPDENCDICGGDGYVYDDELHLVRRRLVAPVIGLSGQERTAPVGIMNVFYVTYYFKYYVNPKKEDKIIEIENNRDGNPVRPFSMQEIYNISVAEPFRDQRGRVEYWRASCKLEVI